MYHICIYINISLDFFNKIGYSNKLHKVKEILSVSWTTNVHGQKIVEGDLNGNHTKENILFKKYPRSIF